VLKCKGVGDPTAFEGQSGTAYLFLHNFKIIQGVIGLLFLHLLYSCLHHRQKVPKLFLEFVRFLRILGIFWHFLDFLNFFASIQPIVNYIEPGSN
jgi:hypothetical protein